MTDFWSSHFHIPVGHDKAWVYRFDYDATIRDHALGTFEDLLVACSLHPAMRVYLDNWKSVRNAPNENQGRELLELHTVGRDAGYTEDMVKASAKILSGYTVDWGTGKTFNAVYDPTKHTTGAVSVLGFSHANSAADGQAVTIAYLKYLAHHPATARRIATKLATYFVSDSPSDGLVSSLAAVYTSSGTDISAVLTALAGTPGVPHLARAARCATRTPTSWPPLASWTSRSSRRRRRARSPTPPPTCTVPIGCSPGHARTVRRSTARPGPRRPACSPATPCTRTSPVAGGRPRTSPTAPGRPGSPPRRSASTTSSTTCAGCGSVVPADARLLRGVNQAVTGPEAWAVVTPATVITKDHALAGWLFPRLAMAMLDSPDHMTT